MSTELWLLFAILVFSYTAQAISGFGAVVIAVTLGANLYPIDKLVPVFAALNILITGYLTVRYFAEIDRRLLLAKILPWMGAGLAAGLVLFEMLMRSGRTDWLKIALGVLVALLSLRELVRMLSRPDSSPALPRAVVVNSQIFGAGVIHGMYATGGPLLVYAITRMHLGKAAFRSTLSAVWLVLNLTLTVVFLFNGRLNMEAGAMCLKLSPALLIGVALGEFLHHRIPERAFRILTFVILLGAGVSLLRSVL